MPQPVIVTRTGGPVMRPDLCDASELIMFPITPLPDTTPGALNEFLSVFNDCSVNKNCNIAQMFAVGMMKSTVAMCEAKYKDNFVVGVRMSFNISSLKFDLPDPKFIAIQVIASGSVTQTPNSNETHVYRTMQCITANRINMPTVCTEIAFDKQFLPPTFSSKITIKYLFC